ncbi:DUF6522 family protein [uncultured Aliiroseovarius sp.]|uniref:DUF6522 family protein n=1 Tax=uncultured Aliiroseovarius sp. TaxID=1658783 RepID=UPI002595AE83|nr:DUF6522 family protein [uncultured Aliiroseovarius sp.]
MAQIELANDQVRIDADIVAKAFRIDPRDLQDRMREGTITSRFEQGEGEDAGKVRLTFFSEDRKVRITADEGGNVLNCSAIPYLRPGSQEGPATEAADDT